MAFRSDATNLVTGDTNGVSDIFVHDTQTNNTTIVSKHTDGNIGNSFSYNPSISSDGRYVAFHSYATTLVDNDTNGYGDIFVHDRNVDEDGIFDETGAVSTTLVSRHTDGTQADNRSYIPSISSDGRYVAFYSYATNIVDNDINGYFDIFVHDTQTSTTVLVSKHTDGTIGNSSSYNPSV